ncbi:MAG: hypothetical protein ABFD04_02170 [Syntrophomonas sp.]
MNTEKILKEARAVMLTCLAIGMVLLATGVVFRIAHLNIISNNNALIGLSFIPLSLAFIYYYKISMIRKNPQKMRETIINENDERLVALKNEVDAKAFKIVQGAIILTYSGYTFMVPADIFESVGWWILLILLFLSFISQGILGKVIMPSNIAEDSEE